MKVGIDIQCMANQLTGVGYRTLGLLEGLASLSPQDRIFPFYFSRRGQIDLPPRVYKALTPRRKSLPGRLLSLGWKLFNFPPVDWLIPGMDCYHFPNFVARPVRGKPVVTTVHDLSFKRFPHFTEPKNLKYLEKFVPRSLERSALIIAVSEFTKKELLGCFPVPEDKVRVVYGGVDDIFRRKATPDELMRVRYQYNLPEKYVLTVATWEPRKNLSGLLEAWKRVNDSGKAAEYKLVLVGMKGWLCEDIERRFRSIPGPRGVRVIGYLRRSDLPLVYQGADLFVFPSFYEGQGLPPIEAQASGVPVAASRVASLPEVLQEGAVYFDPHSPAEMAATLVRALSSPGLRKKLKLEGAKRAQKFTWTRTAEETLAVYRQACGISDSVIMM